jgi:hypothetical protein
MLSDDCASFLDFVRERDPVVVVLRDSDSPRVEAVGDPCEASKATCLWNQSLLPALTRSYIPNAESRPYSRADDDLPLLEFSASIPVEWEGLPGLLQGRIWGAFETTNQRQYRVWYEAIVRWIRKRYIRYEPLKGYIGPAAREWHKRGGILLPMFKPPVTEEWRVFVEKQLSEAARTWK